MEPLIHLEGITHHYGSHCALRDVSVRCDTGAIGLVGQNGAGKTTMMQIILGFLRPTSGTVRVLGFDVPKRGVELRGRVGYMPERDAMIPGLSGVEYVALAGELCGMKRKQAKIRAHETLSYLELEDARYRKIETYSLGMKQRLKLAATLVHDPDLLLLDEPTAGLDPNGRSVMLDLLGAISSRRHKSLILSTHLLGDIERVCQHTIILNEGRVIGQGGIDDLRAERPRRYQLRWQGAGADFLLSLRRRASKVDPSSRPNQARIHLPDNVSTREVFAIALQTGVLVTGLEPEQENLETAYHRLIGSPRPSSVSEKEGTVAKS